MSCIVSPYMPLKLFPTSDCTCSFAMAATAIAATVLADQFRAASVYLTSQQSVMPAENVIASKEAMVVSLMSQVANFQKLAIQDAGALNSALSETCFDDTQKLRLATAINIKVNESASSQQ